jgi:hypothetical protein
VRWEPLAVPATSRLGALLFGSPLGHSEPVGKRDIAPKLLTSRSSDRLDVVHAAAVPLRADLGAARGGKVLKQARHRAGGSVCGYQIVATEGCLPVALAAGNEDCISQTLG